MIFITMNKNSINTIIKYCIFIGLAFIPFIPLYVANSLFFPFITGKAFAFRIIVEIIFALWLVLVLREKGTTLSRTDKSVVPRVNIMTIFVTTFTVVVLIADLSGVNPLRSIWSNSERMEGWMTIVHLWAYFMVLSSVFGTGDEAKRNWFRFLNIILVAGTIVAFYGLFQFFGWAAIHQGSTRVDASLGNSAYMAVYMLINAFLAAYMVIVVWGNKKLSAHKALVWTYSILALLFSFNLFQTATRGTILGWIIGILIACGIYVIFGQKGQGPEKGQSNKSRLIAGGTMALIVLIGIIFYFNRNTGWIQNNEVLGRLATISINDTKTQARGYVWPMAIKGSFSSAKTSLIGWGQENFNYIFNANYNPKMWSQEQWFDRAHSVFLDWLVASGILGLALYLALYIISLIYICKSNITVGQKSVLIALLSGYGIHNIFVFDNQTSYVMFFTILAFIHSFKDGKVYSWLGNSSNALSENSRTVRDYIFVPIIVIAFMVSFYFINIRVIQANTGLIKALRACSDTKTTSTQLFTKALSLNQTTVNQEIREQIFSCASNVIRSNLPTTTKTEFYNLVKSEIDKQIATTPNDARAYVISGSFYNSIGDWNAGQALLEKAHALSPTKQTISFELASNYINTNKPKEALDLIQKAYESAMDNPTSKTAYVLALINAGEEKRAHELFANEPGLFIDQRIASIYASKKQYDKVVEIYKQLVIQNADDVQTHVSLVAAYLGNNQISQALAELNLIKQKFPQTKDQVDVIIKQIQEGKNPLQ